MQRIPFLAALAAAAVAAVAATPTVSPAAVPASSDATVTVEGTTISVSGSLDAPLEAESTGSDATGDSTMTGAGADLSGLAVDFTDTTVDIMLSIDDANPGTGHMPYGAQYEVIANVAGTDLELIATATATGLVFASQVCVTDPTTGAGDCTSAPVQGGYADGVLTWSVTRTVAPKARVKTSEASVSLSLATPATTLTISGATTYDSMTGRTAFAPAATLLIDAVETGSIRLTDDGFEIAAAGIAAGEHAVAVELCGADDDDCTVIDLGTVTVE